MKISIIILLLVFNLSLISKSQIITTFAGNGVIANTGDGGSATAASIDYPGFSVFDNDGNYYIATGTGGRIVRKIDRNGIITNFAGTPGVNGNSGDGFLATDAKLKSPIGLAVDKSGNVFISDSHNNNIRKVNPFTGLISLVCGTGVAGYSGDGGNAISATLSNPNGICIDKFNNLYIADYGNHRIRKVDSNGIITTFAGNGVAGFSGDGGMANMAQIRGVFDVTADTFGNVYIADEANGRIRKVELNGLISTIAGTGIVGYSGDGGLAINANISPHDVTCDKFGNIYTCDLYENKIRIIKSNGIIELLAGTGELGFSGDGGHPLLAKFRRVYKVAIDTCNNLYFSDLNNYRVRKISYNYCNYLSVNYDVFFNKNIGDTLFPNPFKETIKIKSKDPILYLEIIDLFGNIKCKRILDGKNNSIDISFEDILPAGVYIVRVNDVWVGKVVKE